MIFWLVSIAVPVVLYLGLPKVVPAKHRKTKQLLAFAGLLFLISFWLPSPLINGQETQFMTHFVGGGIFSGLVWLYLVLNLGWNPKSMLVESVSLFAVVSSLGVANEIFEILLYQMGLMPNGITDTSWDLLANTLGAGVFYLMYLWVWRNDPRH